MQPGQTFEYSNNPGLLAGSASAKLIEVDDSYCFADVTEELLNLAGFSRSELIGSALNDVLPSQAVIRLKEALDRCSATGDPEALRDIEFCDAGTLPLDVVVTAYMGEEAYELILIESPRTHEVSRSLLASLLEPSSRKSPSMLIVSDVQERTIRATRNNLTQTLGLPNSFRYDQFLAAAHPEDALSEEEYLKTRLKLEDGEYITFDQRVLAPDGSWHVIVGRSRVLQRGPDGTPTKMIGAVFEATQFHTVLAALQRANVALVRAQEEERARLGRDLHDALGQLLTGAALGCASLKLQCQSEELQALADEIQANVRAAQEEVRAIAFLLHPPELESCGLLACLERLCTGLSSRLGLDVSFHGSAVGDLPPEVELALFRIAQESMLNIHKHANASRAELRIEEVGEGLIMTVADDGIGIPHDQRSLDAVLASGVGIAGMHARISRVGGRLKVEPANPGTRIIAECPIR